MTISGSHVGSQEAPTSLGSSLKEKKKKKKKMVMNLCSMQPGFAWLLEKAQRLRGWTLS